MTHFKQFLAHKARAARQGFTPLTQTQFIVLALKIVGGK
jgi:hypothetical protein